MIFTEKHQQKNRPDGVPVGPFLFIWSFSLPVPAVLAVWSGDHPFRPDCAKSGTAEVGGDKQPHAWFVGFVDDVNTPLAFLVLVENGGSGASVAGSIAAQVLAQAAAN